MVFCKYCGNAIHESAPACTNCGGEQLVSHSQQTADGPLWVPITSLVLGTICTIALLDDSTWDKETIFGQGFCALVGLVLGSISLKMQETGKRMAIAGTVLSSIGLLFSIGMYSYN